MVKVAAGFGDGVAAAVPPQATVVKARSKTILRWTMTAE